MSSYLKRQILKVQFVFEQVTNDANILEHACTIGQNDEYSYVICRVIAVKQIMKSLEIGEIGWIWLPKITSVLIGNADITDSYV